MSDAPLPVDPLWPRAGDWPAPTGSPDAVILGVPAWRTSLSPTGDVEEGETITLDVLGAPPAPSPTPTPSETATEEPVDPGNSGNGNAEDPGKPDDKVKPDKKGD